MANMGGRAVPDVRRGVTLETVVDRSCRERGIQFLWFITPYRLEIPDVPYLAMVFDMQHQLQPWFPEVSARGEWDRRAVYPAIPAPSRCCRGGERDGRNEEIELYRVPAGRVLALPHPTPAVATDDMAVDDDELLRRMSIPTKFFLYPAQTGRTRITSCCCMR